MKIKGILVNTGMPLEIDATEADILQAADEIRNRKPGLVKGALVSNEANPNRWHPHESNKIHDCDALPRCNILPPWDVMARTLACWEPEARWATCSLFDATRGLGWFWKDKPELNNSNLHWSGAPIGRAFLCARPEHPETCIIEIERVGA
jgi:hypothetical protein